MIRFLIETALTVTAYIVLILSTVFMLSHSVTNHMAWVAFAIWMIVWSVVLVSSGIRAMKLL